MEAYEGPIPDYAHEALLQKETRIKALERRIKNGTHFVFFTDYHAQKYNCGYSPAMIRHLLTHTCVTHAFFGGDAVNHELSVPALLEQQAQFLQLFDFMKPEFYTVIGNHEYYADVFTPGSAKPTTEQVFSVMCSHFADRLCARGPMGAWALRRANEPFFYLAIPCDFDCQITSELVTWALETLLRVPQDCAVIVVGHALINNDAAPSVLRDGYLPLCQALDALNEGRAYTYGGSCYDYSGAQRRQVVCVLSGHTHEDGTFRTEGGIPLVVTTSDAGIRQDYSQDRSVGTFREQAFDVVDVDLDQRMLYLTRIGAGEDRELSF